MRLGPTKVLSTSNDHWDIDGFRDPVWPFPLDRPSQHGEACSNQEGKQEVLVQSIGAINPLGSDHSEEQRRREEGGLSYQYGRVCAVRE
jgi:hypothetical protein